MKNQRGCLQNGGYYGSNVSVLAWLALLIEQIAVVRSPGFKMAATNGQTLNMYMVYFLYCNISKDDKIKTPWCSLLMFFLTSYGCVEDRFGLQYYVSIPYYI